MDNAAEKRADRLIIGMLILVTLAVYWQVWDFEFTNYDDDVYVENNPVVLAGLTPQGIKWALRASYQATWQPLVWMSLMADAEIGKWAEWIGGVELGTKNAGIYHLTNVAMHVANTLLLFVLLTRLTRYRWRSAFVAALFAVHPLHVESVAWITERKDVLSSLFWMLATLAYVDYVQRPCAKRYMLLVGAFVLGLMSKPMLVTLPLTFVMLDHWPLGRGVSSKECAKPTEGGPSFRTRYPTLWEKTPLFVLMALGCVMAYWAQKSGGAIGSLQLYPPGVRLANALVSYVVYLKKMLLPVDLAVVYPHPGGSIPSWQVAASGALVICLTVWALRCARSRPYFTVGWLWYVVTLLPVIGIVQFGKHALADRFTYIPLVGIFIVVAWGVPEALAQLTRAGECDRRLTTPLAAAGALAVLALMVPTYIQIGYWRNSITLFSRAIKVTNGNSLAHNNLGNALMADGDPASAIPHFRQALKYHPEYLDAEYNLGNALYENGDIDGAVRQYRKVIRIAPKHVSARNNLGSILAQQGRLDEAIQQFSAVLRIDPDNSTARQNIQSAKSMMDGSIQN